ncbi:MAG: C39 family peptidase [Myxococcales bacterium]|nr:C39 family peptidase [Myxococcales bacterium]
MNKLWLLALTLGACMAEAPGDGTPDDSTDPGDTGDPGGGDPMDMPGAGSGTTGASAYGNPADTSKPWRIVPVAYEVQSTGYWCGPTATKMALSARMTPPSQQALANQLGTTTNGTDWVGQITNVLNNNLRAKWFVTREMPNDPPTPAQRDQLWRDVVRSIDNGFPFVANIVAPPSNHPPGYPNSTIYHYFTVNGYNPQTRQVYISDSANFSGMKQYWLSFDQLATLIPPKGYTAPAPCARDAVVGLIAQKYDAIGGCNSVIGPPITEERATPDGVGRYSVFERGSIYWTPALGAHEVHGKIRDAWAASGWEAGPLGYPISDEYAVGDGRRSDFQRGYIHWHATTGETTIGT